MAVNDCRANLQGSTGEKWKTGAHTPCLAFPVQRTQVWPSNKQGSTPVLNAQSSSKKELATACPILWVTSIHLLKTIFYIPLLDLKRAHYYWILIYIFFKYMNPLVREIHLLNPRVREKGNPFAYCCIFPGGEEANGSLPFSRTVGGSRQV